MPDKIISQFERAYNLPIEIHRKVVTSVDRNSIPANVRWQGMVVHVEDQNQDYQLRNGVDNADWVKVGGSGISGSFVSSDGKTVTVENGLITAIVS